MEEGGILCLALPDPKCARQHTPETGRYKRLSAIRQAAAAHQATTRPTSAFPAHLAPFSQTSRVHDHFPRTAPPPPASRCLCIHPLSNHLNDIPTPFRRRHVGPTQHRPRKSPQPTRPHHYAAAFHPPTSETAFSSETAKSPSFRKNSPVRLSSTSQC